MDVFLARPVDLLRADGLGDIRKYLGQRILANVSLYRGRAAPPNVFGVSHSEIESPFPGGLIRLAIGQPRK